MEMKDRIAQRMSDLAMTQDELSQKTKLSQVMIHKLLKGSKTRKILALAKALQCDPDWLESGEGGNLSPDNAKHVKIKGWIPLISYVQAGEWCEAVDIYEPGYAEKVAPTTVPHSERTFALQVEGDSMTLPSGVEGRSFPPGMVIYVDPEREALPGDYVVAKHNGNSRVTFKRLMIEEGRPILVPLNTDRATHPVIRDEFSIIGRVIDASWGGF